MPATVKVGALDGRLYFSEDAVVLFGTFGSPIFGTSTPSFRRQVSHSNIELYASLGQTLEANALGCRVSCTRLHTHYPGRNAIGCRKHHSVTLLMPLSMACESEY